MRSSSVFILLEYFLGLTLALLAMYLLPAPKTDLAGTILFTFLKALLAILLGVSIVGYYHLRSMGMLNRYGRSFLFCFTGLVLFSVVYTVISPHVPSFFIVALPLSGAVIGFNFRLARNWKAQK